MKYWVLCQNDFPAAVYDSEEHAEAARVKMKAKWRPDTPRIHWHVHGFELNKEPPE